MYLLYEQTTVVPINVNTCYLKTRFCIILAIKRNKHDGSGPCPQVTYHPGTQNKEEHVALLKVFSFVPVKGL